MEGVCILNIWFTYVKVPKYNDEQWGVLSYLEQLICLCGSKSNRFMIYAVDNGSTCHYIISMEGWAWWVGTKKLTGHYNNLIILMEHKGIYKTNEYKVVKRLIPETAFEATTC